jgi:hypothetical protein
MSFGVGLLHFPLTRSRQHCGVTFSFGEGSTTARPGGFFFASLVNLCTASADRLVPGDCTVRFQPSAA